MRQIKTFFLTLMLLTLVGMAWKVPFLLIYGDSMGDGGVTERLMAVAYGFRLDVAIASYLTLPAALMLLAMVWWGEKVKWLWRIYFAIVVPLTTLAYVANIGLYAYWGFPLDNTPLLYISTSPADALASMTLTQIVGAPTIIIVVSALLLWVIERIGRPSFAAEKGGVGRKAGYSVALVVLASMLIIPIRGGIDTGTNHTGSVYFSRNTTLNHAAVNPVFSFFEAVTHQEDIATRYRFMSDEEASSIMATLTKTSLRDDAPQQKDYNVVLICLESFSKYIMGEGGHEKDVTPHLDRLTTEGLYFTRIYASSFRTDRGMVSVMSGLPAQPTMSVMNMPRICTTLPSIARTLQRDGYDTHFYYGGDTSFSNMRAYIVGTGFDTVTSEFDFPMAQRTGKWGVADQPVFDMLLNDIKNSTHKGNKPFYKVFMTSSSHEPFDVPDYHRLPIAELNAFAYTDEQLGHFVERLKATDAWTNTLVVIIPDHLGAWPRNIDNFQLWRYEIPLIILGGPVGDPRRIDTVGSQTDVAATLLSLMGRGHEEFVYSKDLLDPQAPHFAVFSFPDAIGFVDAEGHAIYDNTRGGTVSQSGPKGDEAVRKAQAYVQKLYDDLDQRKHQDIK